MSRSGGVRMKKMLQSGIVPIRGGYCIDLYNMQVHKDVHITITARYDDGNKWVTVEE